MVQRYWYHSSFNPHTHEGCDPAHATDLFRYLSFNPHTHEGCDGKAYHLWWYLQVSIHTPTKGVTYYCLVHNHTLLSFNPHTHEGCDTIKLTSNIYSNRFQSTHPRRVWPSTYEVKIELLLFQSTHPRRVWHVISNDCDVDVKFQSTHPRRVWQVLPQRISWCSSVSIHTPTKGVTFCCQTGRFFKHVSIHTPTKGVTFTKYFRI